ncbi:MAG: valine--tRNA ligase [Dehalococcoidia bacterium SG8_51_3]|nr:MAG: valine--tRNA ligase [Dehalococcoidia bacterium SG8_51_3]
MSEIPKAYEPGKIEKKWYGLWLEQGYFTPEIDRNKKPFVIIMPPTNVTGELHLGHALTATLEDIIVRWHRMRGEPTLWLPGTDHAGIATQVVVERQLARQGQTRDGIGREQFAKLTWEWANKSRDNIRRQHQLLGASCDWTREKFTLDDGPSKAVRTAFVRLYDKGLIYRGERMINWCPRCRTALSDLEVQHKDIVGNLYYIHYPLARGKGFITVATTRPETFLGDTAVAVNPADKRYRKLIGTSVMLPIIDKEIPVIADDAVDTSFGTGALKITPAHDPTDFEVAQRRDLPLVDIMNPDATMRENAGPYRGLERFACRDKVLADLKDRGLLEKIEPYSHSVGHCGRCQTMIEPKVSLQWFVRTQPLAKAAIDVVREGGVAIIPERFVKIYFDWMENIRDWCISRQLWWGHRIPVWYCQGCAKVTASVEEPVACIHCGSKQIIQDPDVLDTWFSSALWPHSTLGWPEDTDDLRYFYPGSVMETGYDILFFWVARMIMMGLEDTGEIPFHTVYLHGLIRDESGEKMSKLRGNVINPAEAIGKYGVDALRFALTTGTSPGNDINVGESRLESSRNFVNKLWNAARFILQSTDGEAPESWTIHLQPQETEDQWINSQLNRLIRSVTGLMDNFQFGEAEQQIYDFVWSKFCDWYIEIAKIRLHSQSVPSPLPFLVNTLEKSLRLLHPFMPFVTEEIWQSLKQHLPGGSQMPASIVIAPYPVAEDKAFAPEAERVMDAAIEIVHSIRNVRAQHKVKPGKWIEARVYTGELLSSLVPQTTIMEILAKARPLTILDRQERESPRDTDLVLVLKEAEVVVPLAGMVDRSAEKQRLKKESGEMKERMAQLEVRLGDKAFLSKAPSQVVEKEKQKLSMLEDKLNRLNQELSQLNSSSMDS